jgi:phosphatidylglycerophosphate synthase
VDAEPVRRSTEIEEATNLYIIHPMAARLTTLLAALRIKPNAVSLTGMAFGLLAAVCYYHYRDVRYAIAGFGLMVAWHVLDGADGQLARLTNSQSEYGKILDGICDYVTYVSVYCALALSLSRQGSNWVWLLVIAAGICHALQAAAYEVQRQEYNYWGLGRSSQALPDLNASAGHGGAPWQRLFDTLYRGYVRMQYAVAGVAVEFYAKLAAVMASEPQRAGSIRSQYRDAFAPAVRRWSLLSSNYRTAGIFVCALFKAPQVYFWFEIIGFTAIWVLLLVGQQARYRTFLAGLAAQH